MDLSTLAPPRVLGCVPFRAISHAHVALSPGGRHVALLSARAVELFDEHGARLARLERHDVRACGCFLDDRRLLVGRDDGALLLFDVDALARAGTLRDADALALGDGYACTTAAIGHVALSPDGATVAVACGEPAGKHQKPDRRVHLLDAATLRKCISLKGMRRRTTDLAFSSDHRLAVAGDSVVRVFELSKGRALATVGDPDDHGVAWRPDGALLTLGQAGGLRAWNLSDGSVLRRAPYPQQALLGPRVTPDGAVVVVTGGAFLPMVVERLDAATFAPLATRTFDRVPNWPGTPHAAADGTIWVAHGLAFERLRGPALTPEPIGDGAVDLVPDFAVHPGGRWGATGDFSSNVHVWDLDAGRVVYAFPVETTLVAGTLVSRCRVKALAVSPRAPRVFLVTERGGIRTWDGATGEPGWSLSPEAFPVPLRIFPTPDGEAVLRIDGGTQGIALVDSSGRTVWRAEPGVVPLDARWEDDAVLLFDLGGAVRLRLADGAVTDRWPLPPNLFGDIVGAFAASDDGALAAAAVLGRLVVWRTEGAEVIANVRTHLHGLGRLTGLCWTADQRLLTVDDDTRVEERDPATLAVLSTATLALPARWTVHVVRGGRRLVAPTHEGPWLVYEVDATGRRGSDDTDREPAPVEFRGR